MIVTKLKPSDLELVRFSGKSMRELKLVNIPLKVQIKKDVIEVQKKLRVDV